MARERNELVLADLVSVRAERTPDVDVLTFEHPSRTAERPLIEVRAYGELAEHGNRLAAWLVGRRMKRGDRFALSMRNHPQFVEMMIAASITGTIIVPIDPRTKGDKLAFMMTNAGCRGVVCADYNLLAVDAAVASLGSIEWLLVLETREEPNGPDLVDVAGVESMRTVLAQPRPTVGVRLERPDDPLQIIYTSGTTGDPKGVVFPNSRFGLYGMLGYLLGYEAGDRPYTGLSLTHGNAQAVTLAPALNMGLRAVFSRRFTKSRLWDVCRAHGCTTFSMLGGMAAAIYSEPPRPDDADNPVRFVVSAGMPTAIWEPFERRFGVDIFEWYGAVEGGLACKPIKQGPVGSFGKPVAGLDMQVLDSRDEPCLPGVVGEICSRPADGSAAAVDYFDNPEASASKVRGGWLRSGDMGHTDGEGWFFFDHRKGGGIRRNGDFVHSGFVERLIAEHPSVSDVFVYGVPASSGAPGEKDAVAAVVPTERSSFDASAVFAACRAGLEANFVPSWIQLVDEIPKTASEKPQERFLLERFDVDDPSVFAESVTAPTEIGPISGRG